MQNILERPQSLPLPNLSVLTGVLKKMDTPTKIFIFFILGSLWAVLLVGVVISFLNHQLVIDTSLVQGILLFAGPLVTALIGALTGVSIHKGGQNSTNGNGQGSNP